MRIFLAGAAGVIGRRLTPLLVLMGHAGTGTTRSAAKAGSIEAMCGRPVTVDVFDADALKHAAVAARPDVVIHQLTDLPDVNDPAKYAATREANARIRIEGTRNLMAAAKAGQAHRRRHCGARMGGAAHATDRGRRAALWPPLRPGDVERSAGRLDDRRS